MGNVQGGKKDDAGAFDVCSCVGSVAYEALLRSGKPCLLHITYTAGGPL